MGTQGLVTVIEGGSVVMKIVAGSDGYYANSVAKEIKLRWPVTITEAYAIAKLNGFGSEECLVVITADNAFHYCNEDLPRLYRETFEQLMFNPRWKQGTADHIVVIDVTKLITEDVPKSNKDVLLKEASMKKKKLESCAKGSADLVVAHGKRQKKRGRRFSMSFGPITNPEKAWRAAINVIACRSTYSPPKGKLHYEGDFVLELTASASLDVALTAGAVIYGSEVHASGEVAQSMGGVQLRNDTREFCYGYAFLKAIRKANGEYIWKNFNYDKM